MDDKELVKQMTKDLKPVKKIQPPARLFAAWLLGSLALVAGEFFFTGGIRKSAWFQLSQNPRFVIETAIIGITFLLAGMTAISMAIPNAERSPIRKWLPPILLLVFGSLIIYGLWNPALEPSEDHHRYFCEIQALVFGFIPAFILFRIIKMGNPTEPGWTGALATLASIGLPMFVLQVGCMYSPVHILVHHVIPLLIFFIIGFFVGKKWLNWL